LHIRKSFKLNPMNGWLRIRNLLLISRRLRKHRRKQRRLLQLNEKSDRF